METQHMWNSCDGVCGAVRGAEKSCSPSLAPLFSALCDNLRQRFKPACLKSSPSDPGFPAFHLPYLLPTLAASHLVSHSSSLATHSYLHLAAKFPLTHFYNCLTVLHLSFLLFSGWCRLISSIFIPHLLEKNSFNVFDFYWIRSFLTPPSSCWKHADF